MRGWGGGVGGGDGGDQGCAPQPAPGRRRSRGPGVGVPGGARPGAGRGTGTPPALGTGGWLGLEPVPQASLGAGAASPAREMVTVPSLRAGVGNLQVRDALRAKSWLFWEKSANTCSCV